jgi:hypothetical protein
MWGIWIGLKIQAKDNDYLIFEKNAHGHGWGEGRASA